MKTIPFTVYNLLHTSLGIYEGLEWVGGANGSNQLKFCPFVSSRLHSHFWGFHSTLRDIPTAA